MSFSLRKAAAASLGAALIGSAMTVSLGTGVANAFEASTCTTSATKDFSNAGTFGTKYHVEKSVDGDGTVGANGNVAFVITVSGAGGLITQIRDIHPAGFEMVKVESNVDYLIGGPDWVNETRDAKSAGGVVSLSSRGWTTAGTSSATLRITYKAPGNIMPGAKINAGGAGFTISAIVGGNPDFNDMNLCLTGRIPNPVEGVIGSLGSVGLGSIGDMFGSASGSLNDPSSPIQGFIGSIGG